MNPYYKDYQEYLSGLFPGLKVQKLSVNAGFGCPNRDGTIGTGGCIYCDNSSFTPRYCNSSDSVAEQLRKGKDFFSGKYPEMKYLAYFQSFTGTHVKAPDTLKQLYQEALAQPDIVGIVVGTRPDCLPPEVMGLLEKINRDVRVIVEIGAETSHDETLRLINRCHNWRQVEDACNELSARGVETGLHLIAGLPGENDEDVIVTARRACGLPVSTLKFHQLQIISGTPLHDMYEKGAIQVDPYSVDRYLDLCVRLVDTVGRRKAIERFVSSAPPHMVVTPKWGLKNYEFTNMLINRLAKPGKESINNLE